MEFLCVSECAERYLATIQSQQQSYVFTKTSTLWQLVTVTDRSFCIEVRYFYCVTLFGSHLLPCIFSEPPLPAPINGEKYFKRCFRVAGFRAN